MTIDDFDYHSDENPSPDRSDLDISDQQDILAFLRSFGIGLEPEANELRDNLWLTMRDARIQIVEHLVRTGQIEEDAAEVTLEAIDALLSSEAGLTVDTIRNLLADYQTDEPKTVDADPNWTLADYQHRRSQGPLDDMLTDEEEEAFIRDADMFGIYDS